MTRATQIEVEASERDLTAKLDRDVAAMIAQGADFQQRLNWFAAAGQPIPPQFFLSHADLLMRWIEHVRQYDSAAKWLSEQKRPASTQRLAAIIDDLSKAVPRYHAMAGQETASWANLVKATVGVNREIDEMRAKANADSQSAHNRRGAKGRDLL